VLGRASAPGADRSLSVADLTGLRRDDVEEKIALVVGDRSEAIGGSLVPEVRDPRAYGLEHLVRVVVTKDLAASDGDRQAGA
jgi:hypothetical protein